MFSFLQRLTGKASAINPLTLPLSKIAPPPPNPQPTPDIPSREHPERASQPVDSPTTPGALFAFVDPKDPFSPGEIAGESLPGPILSILGARPFVKLYLFHTPHMRKNAEATKLEIAARHPNCEIVNFELPISDPRDYASVMGLLARSVRDITRYLQAGLHSSYVCVSSGTAEMRAAWFLLAALDVLPAKLLQVGTPARPLFGVANVKEVDPRDWDVVRELAMPLQYYLRPSPPHSTAYPVRASKLGSATSRFQRSRSPHTEAAASGTSASSDPKASLSQEPSTSLGAARPPRSREDAEAIRAKFIDKLAKRKEAPDATRGEEILLEGEEKLSAFDRTPEEAAGESAPELRESLALSEPRDFVAMPALDAALNELGIYVGSASLRHAAEQAAIAAGSHLPILLFGETGTGKERFAHLIHRLSPRSQRELVPVNCAAIPVSLAESYLFGHAKGAFTGATDDVRGIFEAADQGTLFLDEIAELSLDVQAKLLRVIQDGVVQPLGRAKPRKVEVRILAATNRNLKREISAGRFREDLYFRLEVVQINLPALRDRRGEIPELALMLLRHMNQSRQRSVQLTSSALALLERQPWPGNVRDLLNVLERSILYARSPVIDACDLKFTCDSSPADPPSSLPPLPSLSNGFKIDTYFAELRQRLFLHALDLCKGNQTAAAELLGVSKQAVSKFVAGQNDNSV